MENKKNLELLSKLIEFQLYHRIIFHPGFDGLRSEDVPYYQRLLENYYTYKPNDHSELTWFNRSSLGVTLLDENITDILEIEGFFINTEKVSLIYLKLFEDLVPINVEFFDCIRKDLKDLSLSNKEEEKFGNIIDDIEAEVLSNRWRVNFSNELFNNQNPLKVISNPSLFIVQTLVRLWLNY